MTIAAERRTLQAIVAIACLVPLAAGGAGVIHGPAMIAHGAPPAAVDLDSHFRYLSGLLLGMGLGFAACIPAIESRGALFRALGLIVVVGGLGRLLSLVEVGPPGRDHVFGLAMELVATPLLLLWQARVARLYRAEGAEAAPI